MQPDLSTHPTLLESPLPPSFLAHPAVPRDSRWHLRRAAKPDAFTLLHCDCRMPCSTLHAPAALAVAPSTTDPAVLMEFLTGSAESGAPTPAKHAAAAASVTTPAATLMKYLLLNSAAATPADAWTLMGADVARPSLGDINLDDPAAVAAAATATPGGLMKYLTDNGSAGPTPVKTGAHAHATPAALRRRAIPGSATGRSARRPYSAARVGVGVARARPARGGRVATGLGRKLAAVVIAPRPDVRPRGAVIVPAQPRLSSKPMQGGIFAKARSRATAWKKRTPVAGKAAPGSSALTGKAKLKAFQRKMEKDAMRRAVAKVTTENTAILNELAAARKQVGALQEEKHWDWDEIAALKFQLLEVRLGCERAEGEGGRDKENGVS